MTKTIEILACALALFTGSPAAGFAQHDAAIPDALHPQPSGGEEIALGGEEPTVTAERLLVAKDVSDREPVGAASEFSIAESSHLFTFVEVSNPDLSETEITVSWIEGSTGEIRATQILKVGPHKRWRTWARTTAPKQPGKWTAVVTDSLGEELARTDFAMVE